MLDQDSPKGAKGPVLLTLDRVTYLRMSRWTRTRLWRPSVSVGRVHYERRYLVDLFTRATTFCARSEKFLEACARLGLHLVGRIQDYLGALILAILLSLKRGRLLVVPREWCKTVLLTSQGQKHESASHYIRRLRWSDGKRFLREYRQI